jgi:putative transposase
MMTPARARYAGYRVPCEIISHAVWLYFRFPLGLRMVEELLAALIVSHETVRQWACKFGPAVSRRRWTRISSTIPVWSTARHNQCFAPAILSTTDQINKLFHLRRDHVTAAEHRATERKTRTSRRVDESGK